MNSNYKTHMFCTDEQAQKYIDAEWEKREREVFENCKRDIVAQLMATCCIELNIDFGFGKERLGRFKRGVESLFRMMAGEGIFGKPFTTDNCIEAMRSQFGIDFDKGESR